MCSLSSHTCARPVRLLHADLSLTTQQLPNPTIKLLHLAIKNVVLQMDTDPRADASDAAFKTQFGHRLAD